MARFCQYCGSPLEEGKVCSCPEAQEEAARERAAAQPGTGPQPQPQPQPGTVSQTGTGTASQPGSGTAPQPGAGAQPQTPPAAPNPVVVALRGVLPYLRSYVKSPQSAAQELIGRKDLVFALVLLGIQAIVGGLLLFSVMHSICKAVSGIAGLASGFMGSSVSVSASFPMCLIFGILASVVAIVILVVILFAVCKILGANCDFVGALVAAAAHSPFVTVLLLVSFLLFFVMFQLGLLCFLLSVVTWIVLTVPALQALAPEAAGHGKFWICTIVGLVLALLVGGWASSRLAFLSVGHTAIKAGGEKHTINEIVDEMGDVDLEDVLDEIVSDIFR